MKIELVKINRKFSLNTLIFVSYLNKNIYTCNYSLFLVLSDIKETEIYFDLH